MLVFVVPARTLVPSSMGDRSLGVLPERQTGYSQSGGLLLKSSAVREHHFSVFPKKERFIETQRLATGKSGPTAGY